MIKEFRLNQKNNIQIKVGEKWYNLITFTEDCPYGKYGYKILKTNKAFNPYVFFNNEDTVKIATYLQGN